MTVGSLDWFGFVALLLLTCFASGFAGYEVCRSSHRQRGLEVDRIGPKDVLPPAPPSGGIVSLTDEPISVAGRCETV